MPGAADYEIHRIPATLPAIGSQAVDVSTALRGRDQIDITFPDHLAAIRHPLERPVNGLIIAFDSAYERCLRDALVVSGGLQQVIRQTVFEVPLLFATWPC